MSSAKQFKCCTAKLPIYLFWSVASKRSGMNPVVWKIWVSHSTTYACYADDNNDDELKTACDHPRLRQSRGTVSYPCVCLFSARYLKNRYSYRITKLDKLTKMFLDESWKPIYFGIKKQGHESQKSIARLGLCTLLSGGFFWLSLYSGSAAKRRRHYDERAHKERCVLCANINIWVKRWDFRVFSCFLVMQKHC